MKNEDVETARDGLVSTYSDFPVCPGAACCRATRPDKSQSGKTVKGIAELIGLNFIDFLGLGHLSLELYLVDVINTDLPQSPNNLGPQTI